MAQKVNAASIQKHLEVKEIKDDVVILKNKGLRAILMASSVNFALKSTDEQDAVIYQYQNFLNSLDFPLQIVSISRKFDIEPYIASMREKQAKQENELLRIQTTEYIDFVKGLTQMTNIMTQSFYVIIPYSPSTAKKLSFLDQFLGKKKLTDVQDQAFQLLKNNLWQRVEFVSAGLRAMGIKTAPLNSEELIELFYKLYNPSAKEEPKLQKIEELKEQ